MKKILTFSAMLFFSISLFCQDIRTGILKGFDSVPVSCMENTPQIFNDGQELLSQIIRKKIDIAFMPVTMAVKVYNSSKKIVCIGISQNGNECVVTTNKNLKNYETLKYQDIIVANTGEITDTVFQLLLKENNLKNEDRDFRILPVNYENLIPSKLNKGEALYAIVSEPVATLCVLKSDKIVKALDFQQEYTDIVDSKKPYPKTLIVVHSDFVRENPEEVRSFLSEYEKALEWTINNPYLAGKKSEKTGVGIEAYITEKAIPSGNFTYVNGKESKTPVIEFLEVLKNNGKGDFFGNIIPDDQFFYTN